MPRTPYHSRPCHYALRLLDVYLLGQWGTAIVVEPGDEEEQRVEKANEAEVEKSREVWLAEGLVALGVCAELDGGCMYHLSFSWTLIDVIFSVCT